MKKQIHVLYTGRVQGVGFRFTVHSIALDLSILGWVKNLSGGQVELVAQAEEQPLNEFLEKINKKFSNYIKDIDIQEEAITEFKDFSVKFF